MTYKKDIIIGLLIVIIILLTGLLFQPHIARELEEYVAVESAVTLAPKAPAMQKNIALIDGVDQETKNVDAAVNEEEEKEGIKTLPIAEEPKKEVIEEASKESLGGITLSGTAKDGGAKLSWNTGLTASKGFKVIRSTGKTPTYGIDKSVYVSDKAARSYHWETDSEKTYYYRVCTYTGEGCTNYSNIVSIKGSGKNGIDDYASQISLNAQKKSDEKVKLEWSLSNGGAPKGFKVLVDKDKNPKYPDDSVAYIGDSGARSFTVGDLKEGESYYFRVCTYNGGGCSVYSGNEKVEL